MMDELVKSDVTRADKPSIQSIRARLDARVYTVMELE